MTTSWWLGWLLVGVAVAILVSSVLKRRKRAQKVEQTDLALWEDERAPAPGVEPNAGSDAETMPAVLNTEEWRKRG